jgi:Co/Zn/Cd efflux system component
MEHSRPPLDDNMKDAGQGAPQPDRAIPPAVRRTVAVVALANLAYFGVEYAVALAIGSVSLFADSIDFLEDASVNLLVLVAIGWSAAKRRLVGFGLAALLLMPGFAALWTAYGKLSAPVVPEPLALTLTGMGAFAVNLFCALLLARTRHHGGALMTAAFLSARNDVAANVGIVAAGLATFALGSIWPDIIVGLAIAALNATSAYEVYEAATGEEDAPRP